MKSRVGIAAIGIICAVALSGCAGNVGTDTPAGGGEESGVPFGASKEEYIAAFEDIEPINVVTQTTGPKGPDTFSGWKEEAYIAAIEEWSGGKITFDVSYAYAIAPILQADDALTDGRLDMATLLPSAEPSDYPVFNEYAKGATLARDGYPVVGPLHVNAFMLDVGYQLPELAAEFEDRGIHMVLPDYNLTPGAIACTEERSGADDWAGSVVSASNSSVTAELEAIGAATSTIPYNEAFEALQRGALDCAVSSLSITPATGVTEAAPYVMLAGETSIASSPGAMGFNQAFWDRLPLVAQQLFYDRAMDSFIEPYVGGSIVENNKAVALAEEYGGGIFPLSDESQQLIADVNAGILDGVADSPLFADSQAVVDMFRASSDKWLDIIIDDLGFDPDLTFADLSAWLDENDGKADIDSWVDKLNSEIISKHRPS